VTTRRMNLTPLAIAALLTAATPVLGLANRVYVSQRSGNDANSCDNILTPCQTFAGAVLQLNPGGEVIVLDSGGYGPVTITQALTIEAPPGVIAFIHPPSGDAITVSTGSSDAVTLRGLVLNDGSVGINVTSVGTLRIEGCALSGFTSGVAFETAGTLEMKETTVASVVDAAVLIQPPTGKAYFSIDHCRFVDNFLGVYIEDRTTGTASNSVFARQSGGAVGAGLFGPGKTEFNLENCVISNNETGIVSNGALVRVSNSTLTNNDTALDPIGSGSILTRNNNTVQGNTTKGSFTGSYGAD